MKKSNFWKSYGFLILMLTGIVAGCVVGALWPAVKGADGEIAVKGSGCIRTREHFLQLIDMGIDRMGVGYRSTPVVLDCTPEEAKNL